MACDTQFPITAILESNDLDDCLWSLRCVDDQYYLLCRKFAVWAARQVQHLMTDQRSVNALDIAWQHSNGLASDEQLHTAQAAAQDAAQDDAQAAAARTKQQEKLKQILCLGYWVD